MYENLQRVWFPSFFRRLIPQEHQSSEVGLKIRHVDHWISIQEYCINLDEVAEETILRSRSKLESPQCYIMFLQELNSSEIFSTGSLNHFDNFKQLTRLNRFSVDMNDVFYNVLFTILSSSVVYKAYIIVDLFHKILVKYYTSLRVFVFRCTKWNNIEDIFAAHSSIYPS